MPSSTYSSSVSNHVPVAFALIAPVSESTAYSGSLPPRSTQISFNVTQPPRVPFADSRYSLAEVEEYRIATVAFASHSGLGMGSFGDSVSVAAASLRASTTLSRVVAFPSIFGMVVVVVVVVWGYLLLLLLLLLLRP